MSEETHEQELYVERDGYVATIVLNRPHHLNAFTMSMIDKWAQVLNELAEDPECRVIVLTGRGKGFCSGVEIENLGQGGDPTPLDRKHTLFKRIHKIPLSLEAIDKPVIAMVNGTAVGAGLDMALMCDLRIAAKSAKLSEGYVRVGLVPGDGGAYFLPRLVGTAKALELLWTGEFIDAETAERLGMVNHAVDDEKLVSFTYALAHHIASMSPLVVQTAKRAVYQSVKTDLRTALDLISSHMGIIQSTDDSKEALRAFTEKRKGNYVGH
ncbi:enoyl-CoA hydratase/isomerase family protein [Alicyclobacillus cycloheptanicus]|uniref:Enoyl-CoA hydratase/carnithine racemase n=1 Tax=Alicyclobacillus cycloheptanicus TaxID=1457 RepID=A0ABT9XME5_9BACL|nr:enoyl-CoA hydratase-related protein [Alicyclobacillus cycloheptanicus]MDQ0191460.1 enoyl-CoA hydratase/carnithine racemase [Alicyclobacillus cycloheptanicus]WDM00164.1 enoyl-CoA hydratase/isomerase family protein [Alicyclobacillus cycloheptanicus]